MHSLCPSTLPFHQNEIQTCSSQLTHQPHRDSISTETRRPQGSNGGIREGWWANSTASHLGWATFLMSGTLRKNLLPLDQSWKLEIWPSVNNFEINLIQFCSLPANFVYLSHTFKEHKPSLKKCGISSYLLISDQNCQNLPLPGMRVSAVSVGLITMSILPHNHTFLFLYRIVRARG